jgi:hypothetical protein
MIMKIDFITWKEFKYLIDYHLEWYSLCSGIKDNSGTSVFSRHKIKNLSIFQKMSPASIYQILNCKLNIYITDLAPKSISVLFIESITHFFLSSILILLFIYFWSNSHIKYQNFEFISILSSFHFYSLILYFLNYS